MENEGWFQKFPPFIQEFIYREGWKEMRPMQNAAAKVILSSHDNLLLTGPTASGKTEAAFFPILTDLTNCPPTCGGVVVLYVAPLKSLINDQFGRMQEVLDQVNIPLTHWHGDVGASEKEKMLRNPSGILQITPESLESMLMRRHQDIPRLFGALRYIVLDEIHILIGNDRGNQVISQICRIEKMLERSVRRIGLSATLGDASLACRWLGAGSRNETICPILPREKLHWKLALSHFYIQDLAYEQTESAEKEQGIKEKAAFDAGYEFLYRSVYGKRALVFSNSREETEYVTATLRQIAKKKGDNDLFCIHHGNLSAAIREDAERKMKEDDVPHVTCATVTLELGIDIGRLERVAQVDAPTSVCGFLQRLGRSGRRGNPPEMVEVFREETPLPNAPLPALIPWGLLRGIATAELYIKERFIEPPRTKKMPWSLAFHQTLSILASSGELAPKSLADRVLSLPPFCELSKTDYRTLLLSMIENDYIALTEEKGLIVGLAGEKLINSFKFFAVFRDSEDYTVRCEAEEIGTITNPPPIGDRFALAGRVWEVLESDVSRRLVFAKAVDGKMEVSWPGDSGEIHTRILEKMYEVLTGKEEYPYLMPNAKKRLEDARHLAENTGIKEKMLISLGGSSYVLFPWLGTRAFRTLRRFLQRESAALGISRIEGEGCCYFTFDASRDDAALLMGRLRKILEKEELCASSLVGESEAPAFEKYDPYIPPALLRAAFAADRLSPEEVVGRMLRGLPKKEEEN